MLYGFVPIFIFSREFRCIDHEQISGELINLQKTRRVGEGSDLDGKEQEFASLPITPECRPRYRNT